MTSKNKAVRPRWLSATNGAGSERAPGIEPLKKDRMGLNNLILSALESVLRVSDYCGKGKPL